MPDRSRRRARSLQPDCTDAVLLDGPQQINNAQVINDLRTSILCWTHKRKDLPEFFDDEFQIKSVVRQVVSSVVVRTQKMQRRITSRKIAYDYGVLHSGPLPTQNLFALTPVKSPLAFPEKMVFESERIRYNETLAACRDCAGTGEKLCDDCSGTGSLPCGACDEVGEVACRVCSGSGEVMTSATETARCLNCNGRGTLGCADCSGEGTIDCETCVDGSINCNTCAASGKMRVIHFLETETRTLVKHKLFCKNGWVEEGDAVACDSVLMRHQHFKGVHKGVSRDQLRGILPGHLVVPGEQCVDASVQPPTNGSLDTAVRIEARSLFLYHVIVDHNGNSGEFFVGGCSNTVTPHVMPQQSKKLLSRLTRAIAPRVTDHAYIEAVRSGAVCLSDSRLVGLALKKVGVQVELDPDGYEITIPKLPVGYSKIRMGFFHDANQSVLVQSSFLLGDADRDCLPEALALSRKLLVGQIGLVELSGGAIERFYLVDRSRYDTLSVPHYLYLVRKLLSVAHNLKTKKMIGLTP